MIATVRMMDGSPVTATLKSGELRPGSFTGSWSSYEVTSDELPGVWFVTTVGIRGRTDVTIEVAGEAGTIREKLLAAQDAARSMLASARLLHPLLEEVGMALTAADFTTEAEDLVVYLGQRMERES